VKLELVRVYTKDLSLENPLSPAIFGEEWKPEVDMQMRAGGSRLENDLLESTLRISVEARLGGRPAMVIEVVVGGLFALADATDEELARVLAVTCPTTLYPYARETVTALSVRGGFPPFIMQPADFEEIWRRQRAAAAEPAG
jgi:preprotein translocase subunit SecB